MDKMEGYHLDVNAERIVSIPAWLIMGLNEYSQDNKDFDTRGLQIAIGNIGHFMKRDEEDDYADFSEAAQYLMTLPVDIIMNYLTEIGKSFNDIRIVGEMLKGIELDERN